MQELKWEELSKRSVIRQNETIFLTLGLLIFQILLHRIKNISDRSPSKFSYYWFSINGIWIHLYLDPLVGIFRRVPPLAYLYFILDPRYHIKEDTVYLVSMYELLVMCPLCIAITYLFKRNQIVLRNTLIIMVSTFQMVGVVFFVGNEYSRNFRDVCPFGCFKFDGQTIFFFWLFFVVANIFWVVVPSLEIFKAYKELKDYVFKIEGRVQKEQKKKKKKD